MSKKEQICPDCQNVRIDTRSKRCRSCNAQRMTAARVPREKFNPQGRERPMPSFERVHLAPRVEACAQWIEARERGDSETAAKLAHEWRFV